MSRILLRAHKDPFQVASPRRVLKHNLIGENVGNLLFSNASYKLLATRGTTVETSTLAKSATDPRRVDAEYDHLVIPLANAFRLTYASSLDRLSGLIESVSIPVTVLGVGAQLRLDGSADRLKSIEGSVKRFVAAVLDKSPSIGVRGEFTAQYLANLGFSDVEVIGCPSVFLRGPEHRVVKRAQALTHSSRISMNLSPYVKGLDGMVAAHAERYPRLRYTAQHRDALGMLLDSGGRNKLYREDRGAMPTHHGHRLVAEGRTSFFTDPAPWLRYLSAFDFSFGTRIHGNIAALLAGTPAYVLAHDSRTLELARYYDIPHRTMHRVDERTDAARLYEEADFTAYNAGMAPRFAALTAFLEAHGLPHVYQAGEDSQRFDRREAITPYPGQVGGRPALPTPASLLGRLPRLRRPAAAVA